LVRGRVFTESDTEDTQQVVIVNEAMARRFWPNQDVLGKGLRFSNDAKSSIVVGLVRDSKQFGVGQEPVACAYLPLRQYYSGAAALIARTHGRPELLTRAIGREVQSLDPSLPLTTVATMESILEQSLWAARTGATLLVGFGVLALVLSAIGIYGVIAYSVEDRANEIGVRVALGASRRRILGMVLHRALLLTGIGAAGGIAASAVAGRGVANLLYGVEPHDPVATICAAGLLLGVAVAASIVPGWRALRVDPVVALRHQ
jgi:hypothetical protein